MLQKMAFVSTLQNQEILNNTENGLVEDTRFNGVASDGETFTDEGIYTIKAFNRYDDKLEPAVKTIYVGSNNILTAYTKNLNSSKHYEISELNALVDKGYTITDDGDIIEPVVETTTADITTSSPEATSDAANSTTASVKKNESKSVLLIVGGGIGVVALGGIIATVLRKKKNDE